MAKPKSNSGKSPSSNPMPVVVASAYHAMGDCDGYPSCSLCVEERKNCTCDKCELKRAKKTIITKGICDHCGRKCGARVPKDGDGTGVNLYMHNDKNGDRCQGRFVIVDAIYEEVKK